MEQARGEQHLATDSVVMFPTCAQYVQLLKALRPGGVGGVAEGFVKL